jgi:hypothetical protein
MEVRSNDNKKKRRPKMAYIIGLLTEEEEKQLKVRGWEVEEAPKELADKDAQAAGRMRMIWVDANMYSVMTGPDWEEACEECGALMPPHAELIGAHHDKSCTLYQHNKEVLEPD